MRLLNATISLIAIMSGFAWISSANAAVSVLGSGLAQDCFRTAEFGGDLNDGARRYMRTRALEETALSTADKAATFINRGILYSRDNRVDDAIADYNHGLKLDGALGEGYVDRGACEILQRNFETALNDINKGIELHSNKLEIAYYDRAVVDEALGNVKAAYEDYKMAVQLAPDFALASEQLARFKVVRKGSTGT